MSKETVSQLIKKLNSGCAPGIDNVTSEHLKFGESDILCSAPSDFYSVVLTWQIVPASFKTGVIVPIF